MNLFKNILRAWLPLVVVMTGVCGLIYLTTQQILRMNANDPQIQIAEDTAISLEIGEKPATLITKNPLDIATSLAPFLVVYNEQGIPQASSGLLHGDSPEMPVGVFQYVKEHGEDRITWQPEPGLRMAVVVVGYGGEQSGFVMVGRSLREVEKRIDQFGMIVLVAWLAILVATLVLVIFLEVVCINKSI
jgi:hypothetical protein